MRPKRRDRRSVTFAVLGPDDDVTWEQAAACLRAALDRLDGGARMTQPSPVFSDLAHEQWEQLHCRHAEMHFSFMWGRAMSDEP